MLNAVINMRLLWMVLTNALQRLEPTDFTIVFWDFNAHIETDCETWKDVIGKHGGPAFNENGRYLLRLCCRSWLCITNTFFPHRDVHKYAWYRMSQKSVKDYCIVSSDLFFRSVGCSSETKGQIVN